jgi:hypothetical protein
MYHMCVGYPNWVNMQVINYKCKAKFCLVCKLQLQYYLCNIYATMNCVVHCTLSHNL